MTTLNFICALICKTEINYKHALKRNGVTQEELDNIQEKLKHLNKLKDAYLQNMGR